MTMKENKLVCATMETLYKSLIELLGSTPARGPERCETGRGKGGEESSKAKDWNGFIDNT